MAIEVASKADSKFGVFGGVFTPSILTILGVIMYLRLPWLVGTAGLAQTIGIILAAHIVSVCTGLSISSIATDKSVGAGGPYYIVSRSLGLPIGGTLGLALFLGLSFSISLYVIGFSESFLATIGLDPRNLTGIRICGTITVVLITVITFISTSLAIKTQYVILALIGISLLAVFFGSPEVPAETALIGPPELAEAPSLFALFGVFFPAVTGFTAGVNMSGDLKDPKRSIPTGTMAAIGAGMVVYLGLAIFLAIRVRPEELRENRRVLEDLAVWGPAVTAGIWGATLSSALGSILGAPRILQTISSDGITPRWFAKGYGKTNEPRNALLLAFAIGEVGILVAELEAIAEIVSMVFMATYAFLNIACAIESIVSPDFRPEFRIPKTISVVGAVASILLMIQLNLAAMAGATTMMALLYVFLQRRQLQLESGDAWEGVWSSLVRAGLHRLSKADRQHRNWRPNILMFRPDDGSPRVGLRRTASTLITGNGMLTDVRLRRPDEAPAPEDPVALDAGPVVGVFDERVETEDPYETIHAFARHRGFSGLEPNTVLLDWDAYAVEPARFGALVDQLRELDLNTLLFSDTSHQASGPPRVDVWWRSESSPALGIALVRFITSSTAFRTASIRFTTVTRDASLNDGLRSSARRMLEESRVTADVEVLLDTVDPRPLEAHVSERSADARLAIVELPSGALDETALAQLADIAVAVPSVLYVSPGSMFRAVGRVVRATAEAAAVRPALDAEALPELELPPYPAIARHAEAFAERLDQTLDAYFQESLGRLAARNGELLDATEELVVRHLKMLRSGADSKLNPIKRRRLANRVQSAFLMECGKLIDEFIHQDLADQRDILEGRARAFADDESLVDPDEVLVVERDARLYMPGPGDVRELAKLKAAKLKGAKDGETVVDETPTAPLARWYVNKELLEVADDITRAYVHECWRLGVQLLSVFNASRTSMALLQDEALEGEALNAFLEEAREAAVARTTELREEHVSRLAELRAELAIDARELAQRYADDLARIDLPLLLETSRKLPRHLDALRTGLLGGATVLYEHQRAIFERAQVGLKASAFQHRLATIVLRTRESIALEVKSGILSAYRGLAKSLREFLDSDAETPLELRFDHDHPLDPQALVEAFVRDAQRCADELPETVRTLSDQSIQRLSDGDASEVEVVDLPLRRLAQFLVDVELVGPLTEILARVPAVESKAVGVAEDVTRLIGFHQGEVDPENAEGGFHAHMRPVVESSLERLEAEREPLEEIIPSIEETLEAKLAAVLRGTDVYELTSSAEALGQQVRRHHGQRAMSGAQSLALRGVQRVRQALVGAVYGRSAGVLIARRLRDAGEAGTLVDRVMRLVERMSPSADALEDLPFFYRQLFFGKNTFSETFWVERENEVAAARRGIAQHDRGVKGVLVVTGEPDSGKTALCRRMLGRSLAKRPSYWVMPPDAGDASVAAFAAALREATGERGQPSEVIAALPDRSVVVIEDLELWWERTADGLAVIDALLACVQQHGDRVLFVIEVGTHPFEAIDRFRRLADQALAVVECGPLPAEALKEIVMLRHGSTGVGFELDGVPESALGEWRIARLFSNHFTASRGLVGAALVSWITHVEKATDRTMTIRRPDRSDWEILDGLRPEWVAILIQLLLHKRLTRQRLLRISGLGPEDLDHPLDVLTRMGLVEEGRNGVLRLSRFVTHALIDRLRARRMIP
ncbi:MAG: amino acid permease [Sandaracinaceae bacterium]|nr:amino acid permease [Sandaracinaceae bacterium]